MINMQLPRTGVLISYDISDDRGRSRAAATLSGRGWRAVYSGFVVADPTDDDLLALVNTCRAVGGESAHIFAIPWCEACVLTTAGNADETPPSQWVVV